jgi:hypothetical protein
VQRTAVLAILVATAFASPAGAGILIGPTPSPRVQNEDIRHESVVNELEYRRDEANAKLRAQTKICNGNARCITAQKLDYKRTMDQNAVELQHEDLVHAQILARIKNAPK